MTIDERLAFLLQSTESLHASTAELHATTAQLQATAVEQTKQIADITRALAADAENIRLLARVAELHSER